MKWSLRIGRFFGIDVRMHITFLLLVGWFALMYWRQDQSLAAVVAGVAFILSIFLCVILHEFGHALAARRYGIRTRDIILLPIGGVARLAARPQSDDEKPQREHEEAAARQDHDRPGLERVGEQADPEQRAAAEDFANRAYAQQRERKTDAHAERVQHRAAKRVPGCEGQPRCREKSL